MVREILRNCRQIWQENWEIARSYSDGWDLRKRLGKGGRYFMEAIKPRHIRKGRYVAATVKWARDRNVSFVCAHLLLD